ncbi:hypothetical protein Tco_0537717 [Tanacetum coccineum]
MRSLQIDVNDEISNLVDLHMGVLGGRWKWQDHQSLLWLDHHKRRIQALEHETQALDVENKQVKVFKEGYSVTTPQELCRNPIHARSVINHSYGVNASSRLRRN